MLTLFLLIGLACSASAPAEPSQTGNQYATPDGKGRVNIGEGLFILQTALDYTGPTIVVEGAVTWELVGPAKFEFQPEVPGRATIAGTQINETIQTKNAAKETRRQEHGSTFVDSQRVDSAGLKWQAKTVDLEKMREGIRRYNDLVSGSMGSEFPSFFGDTGPETGGPEIDTAGPAEAGELFAAPPWLHYRVHSSCLEHEHMHANQSS